MPIKSLVFLIIFILNSSVLANEFRYEVTVGGFFQDDGEFETKFAILGGRYYIKTIDINLGPWAEDAFLGRSSYVQAAGGSGNYVNRFGGGTSKVYVSNFGYTHISNSGLVLGFNYSISERDYDTQFNQERRISQISVGKYLSSTSGIEFVFDHLTETGFGYSNDAQFYELAYKNVTPYQGGAGLASGMNVKLASYGASLSDGTDRSIGVYVKYYPNRKFGIRGDLGANYSKVVSQGVNIGLSADYFMTKNLFAQISAIVFREKEGFGNGAEQLGIAIGSRF